MKLFLTSVLLFVATLCSAQQIARYYLKNNGKYVNTADSADFIRTVSVPDTGSSLYNIAEYYKNGNQKSIGKSTKIDPPRYMGSYVSFYGNGKRKNQCEFSARGKVGNAYEFYPNGKLYLQVKYPDSITTVNENHFASDYLIVSNLDSLGKSQVAEGQGYYKAFDDKFAYINDEGPVKDGKRDGGWKGTEKKLQLTFTETYKNGELISGSAIDSAAITFTYSGTRATSPKFTGGDRAFGNYLGSHIVYPNYERKNDIEGIVVLQFIVEKDGKINDIKVQKSVSPGLDNEAVRVLKQSPAWVPGTRFGKPVKVVYAVPVRFVLQD